MPESNLDVKQPVGEQGQAPDDATDSSSQTVAVSDTDKELQNIFDNRVADKPTSETEVKTADPVASVQGDAGSEEPAESVASQETQDKKTDKPVVSEPSEEEIAKLPPEIQGKARREKQFKRLTEAVAQREKIANEERARSEALAKQLREQQEQAKRSVPTAIPDEALLAVQQAEAEWNQVASEIQQGTKDQSAATAAYQKLAEAHAKLGEYRAQAAFRSQEQQAAMAKAVEQERSATLETLSLLASHDARFDMTDDLADPRRAGNPQTPLGQMVHEMAKKELGRPPQTWREVELYALKASHLVQLGQLQLGQQTVRGVQNETRSLMQRIGLDSSNRHAPPPKVVAGDEMTRLRARAAKGDKQAKSALIDAELQAHLG